MLYCLVETCKLADTVGPTTFLRLDQDDDFYNVDLAQITTESNQENPENVKFYNQLFRHHTDDDVSEDDKYFVDPDNW